MVEIPPGQNTRASFAAPKGIPEYVGPRLRRTSATPSSAAADRAGYGPRRAAGLRGHRALRPRRRRVHRRRVQGDVHLRRPRRPLGDAAPRGHRGRRARGDRARARPRRAAGQAALRRAVLPLRAPPGRALPPAPAGRASRRSGSTTRRSTPRSSPWPTRASGRSGSPGTAWSSPRSATPRCRPAYRARAAASSSRGCRLDDATRERARINPLRVLDDKRPEVRAQLADAPLLVDHLSDAAAAHHAAVQAAPRRAGRRVRREPADGPRARLLHEDDLRVRPRRARLAVGHRRRRALRRADGRARRAAALRGRVRHRGRPHPARLPRRGARAVVAGAPGRGVRGAAGRGREATSSSGSPGSCAAPGSGSTSPTAAAGSRAR